MSKPTCVTDSIFTSCKDLTVKVIGEVGVYREWYDSRGPDYNCTWYAMGSKEIVNTDNSVEIGGFCKTDGKIYTKDGGTASKMCCACGGGQGRKLKQVLKMYVPHNMEKDINGYKILHQWSLNWTG